MAQGIVILGTYLLAEEMLDLIGEMPGVEVVAFVENVDRARCDSPLEGRPVVWLEEAGKLARTCKAVCGISTTKRKAYCEAAARVR